MRNPERIDKFLAVLGKGWKERYPDMRFGQLMTNMLGSMAAEGRDPFFPEEDEMERYVRKYLGMGDAE